MTADQCPVCGQSRIRRFLRRESVPVHQNLVVATQQAARSAARGDLDLAVCECCGFVFNRAFDLSRLAYGEDYDNTQSCSPYFDAYMDGLVQTLVERCGVRNATIVEVGCGKGQFLRKLVTYPGAGNRGIGFDPSYVGPDSDLNGSLSFRRRYYDDGCTDVAADVVVCRHVIEHVPQPLDLLRAVRAALAQSPGARVFFETPCVEWILSNRVVWDLFYEHCSLFSAASLRCAFERSGFAVERVEHVFGGQYLWLEARVGAQPTPGEPAGRDVVGLAERFGVAERELVQTWLQRLEDLAKRGKVALWGAGAKGATFANLVDPHRALIDCVVDLNPNKQGRFIPGTGHRIVGPDDLAARGVRTAVLMNPNYREENRRLLAAAGLAVDLVDWSDE